MATALHVNVQYRLQAVTEISSCTVESHRWQVYWLVVEVPCAEENSWVTVGVWINAVTSRASVFIVWTFTEEPAGFVTEPVLTAFSKTSKITRVVAAALQCCLEVTYNYLQFLLQLSIGFIICKLLHLHKHLQESRNDQRYHRNVSF